MQEVIKVVAVIIGTIIGAGFISGQEIYSFFNKYGEFGIVGIIISIFLIAFVIYKTYKIIELKKVNNYEEFLNKIIPGNNKFLCNIIKNIINIFLIISFFIMCSAFSTYFFESYKIPKIIGGVIISVLSYIILINDVKIIIKINEFLMPIIILFIFIMFILNMKELTINNIEYNYKAILSGILYANYNMILLLPMLVAIKKYVKNKKQIILISIICFVLLFLLTIIIFEMQKNIKMGNVEMPMLEIAKGTSKEIIMLYGIITIIAIFTSAISAGYSLISNIGSNKNIISAILCIIAIPISTISFSGLVNLLYPIFGILGTIQIIFII